MRSLKFVLPLLVLIAVVFIVGFKVLNAPPPNYTAGTLVLIRPNTNATQVAQVLTRLKIIRSATRFVRLARLCGFDKRIQPGRYLLPPLRSELEVLKIISSPRCSKDRVTIPEGLTAKEIGLILEENGVSTASDFEARARDFKNSVLPFSNVEGYLFPDTYDLPVGLGPKKTIEIMVHRFFEVVDELNPTTQVGNANLRQTVILASLVEKEAKLDRERPIVASVFLNRLRKRMLLESCSTVEYALPEHKTTLTYADLKISSPYNTYLHPGLPPGPICNPGRASLQAALRPAQTDYLYFVAQGDGSHKFSKTFSEHIQAKNRITNILNDSK